MQKESGYYHQQQAGNQVIYPQQLQQIPNVSSQQSTQNTLLQSPMQTQGQPTYVNSAETHTIRPMVGGRMPQYGTYPSGAYTQQGQPTEVVTPGYPSHAYHVSAQTQFMQNGIPQFTQTYGNMNYPPRNSQYPPVYVVQGPGVVQQGNFANNVVLTPQINSSASQSHQIQNQPRQQQQHMYSPMPANVHTSQSPILQQQTQPEAQSQKKRPTIKLTDPNTGKDLTSEILTKKKGASNVKPTQNPDESIKAKTAALFAAQVAEKIAGSTQPQSEAVIIKPPAPAVPVEQDDKVSDTPADVPDVPDVDVPDVDEDMAVETTEEKVVAQEGVSLPPVNDNLDKPGETMAEKIVEVENPPAEKVLENPPAEKVLENPPAEKVLENPPAEKVLENPPAGKVLENPPARKVLENPPAGKVLENPPAGKVLEEEENPPCETKTSTQVDIIDAGDQSKEVSAPMLKDDAIVVENGGIGLKNDAIVVKDDAIVVKDDAVVVKDGAVVVKDDAVVVKDDAVVVKDDAIVVKDDAIVVKDDAIVMKDDAIVVKDVVEKVNELELQENIEISLGDDKADKTLKLINAVKDVEINSEGKAAETKNIEAKPAEVISEATKPTEEEVDKIVLPKTVKEVIEPEEINKVDEIVVEVERPTVVKEVYEEPIEIVPVATTEAMPEEATVPVEKVIKESLAEKEEVKNPITKEEHVKKEKNVKNERNKNDKSPRKEESSAPSKKDKEVPKKETSVREVSKKEATPLIKKDAHVETVIKKDVESVEKESKKKPEKKEPIKTTKDNVKKESSTKEDAIRRFQPSYSNSHSSKPKETQKPKELGRPELLRSGSEPMTKKTEVQRKDSNEPTINGHDESIKHTTANPVTKKKKGKGRFKEFDAKESVNNDMLSAFVDAPAEPTIETQPPEPVKVAEKPPEETTWEDKENSIEKEDILGEDAEDDAAVPKRVQTKILKGEGSSNDEKHQYDREFLLKFQFAPICTSKPAGLPNIDIVLDEAHAPTKALVPGQRIQAANDFMPTFMRQSSGSRNNSATGGRGNSRDKGRGSQTNPARQQKVISIPHLETKLELKKSENAWVRPSQKEKEMGVEEKALYDVNRSVCSILNKLTPQKFKPLVNQMIELKLDNSAKLESAISIIFEKAISEPGFSVAYANMCRVLTDNFNKVPTSNEPNAPVITFRKVLLNKCQTEFEKESSDEKKLEEDRSKTFDREEEKKAHLTELNYREMMNRRRTLGNIRFIGELYKLKMISEPIMHDCIYKLLKAEKQEPLEDQLECLCKLLSTIGKIIDHPKAKPRVDQYFDQMNKIIEKRKISSRIKFALKDVIDLRSSNWVPRRDDGNPKTIDQIHREAQQKEKEEEIQRQQDKLQKKLEPRGGRGGRDSPLVRPGSAPQNSDGWNTVQNKSTRPVVSAPVDASKLRFKKADTSEISLGPGLRPGAWSKGASGGGSSRSGSGSNTPTTELDQRTNRYDALTDSHVAPGSLDHKGHSGSRQGGPQSSRKGMSGGHGSQQGSRNRNDRMEHNEALRAVRDMTGKGSRNQSPARGSRNQSPARGSRNQSPARGSRNESPAPRSSRNQSPAPREYEDSGSRYSSRGQTQTPPVPVNEDKMRKVTKSTIEEYLSCKDEKEAMLCIKELNSPGLHNVFVEESVLIVIEKKPDHRRSVGLLLHKMIKESVLDITQICKGFASMVSFAPDFAVDIPHIYKYLGEVIGPIVYDDSLPLNKVKDTLEPLINNNKAGIVMAEALSVAVQVAGKEELIASLWLDSKITWDTLLSSGENVEQFIKDKKMEFTLKSHQRTTSHSHSSQSLSHTNQIQEEMLRILNHNNNDNNNNDELISYIERHTKPDERNTAEFIQALTTAVCSSCITRDSSNNCECKPEVLKKRKSILLKYIDRSKDLELQSLYALQQLVQELKHPRGLLRAVFDELYEGDIISEETFFIWERSKDSPVGKGPALSSVKDFLSWLRKADEESNDEESPASHTNT